MKVRDVLFFTLFFLAAVAFTTEVVSVQLTGKSFFSLPQKDTEVSSEKVVCSNRPVVARSATNDPQLKAIPDYEAACGSRFFDQMMLFTNMPISDNSAIELADSMTKRLKAFSTHGITPIVIVEPDSEWGLVDFHEFATGIYDPWIKTYFKRLASNGVTLDQMGVWIPFPEPQLPTWNNNADPDDFAHSVNRYFRTLRAQYPGANTAILLDSMVGDESASQLVAYTRLVDESLVDIAGIQGFPWHPSDEGDTRAAVTSASEFAPAYMLEEVAKSLGTKEVLINTGSYRHRKAENGGEVAIPTAERNQILTSIVYEAHLLKNAGYDVTVNVFAENKLDTKEGINWSYWPAGKNGDSTQTVMFTHFIRQMTDKGVKISLFDSRP